MSKGTIIYAGNFYLPDKNASANRVVNNGKLFTALGFNVVFLGTDYSDNSFLGIKPLTEYKNMYAEAHPSSVKAWVKHTVSVDNISSLVAKYSDTVAVILYNAPYVLTKRVKSFCRKKSIKLVYDCTEWTKDTEGSFVKRLVKSLDENAIRNKIQKSVDGLIVISDLMLNNYTGSVPVIKIPPLVDIDDSIWHQERNIPTHKFIFCFAGFIGTKEYLENVISAFADLHLSTAELRIIGVDKDTFIRTHNDMTDVINSGNITFYGTLSHRETVFNILNSDCFIFIRPSTLRNNACFPTKFAEAYTCGCPIITSDISDLSNFVTDSSKGILVAPDDIKAISRAMLSYTGKKDFDYVLNNTFDYRNYIGAASSWVKEINL